MVRRRSRLSAVVRRRCHAIGHSPPQLQLTSCGACSSSSSARLGRALSSRLGGGSSATCPSVSCSGNDRRPPLANRTSLASTRPPSTPGSPTPPVANQRAWLCRHRGGRTAGGARAPRARGQYIRRTSPMCMPSNCVGGGVGYVRGIHLVPRAARSWVAADSWSRTNGRERR
jgi:hypothetical protein